MAGKRDVILIIDDDPDTETLLREQIFAADNFEVYGARDGADGLLKLRQHHPDLIVLDLQLPGLTGRDLLVAINSQGYRGPMIVMVESGGERSAVEAFRLGATDYITYPIRETEAMAAIERGLAEVRLRRQRDSLTSQLQTTNRQLEARVNELTTLYDTGQSVTAMHDLEKLFDRVLDGALSVTGADHAMLLLRDDDTGRLVLRAGKNLWLAMLDRVGEPVQDQLADLVMTSHESLIVAGDSLRRFAIAKGLYAVAYAPVTFQKTAIGVLEVGNHEKQTVFNDNHGRLLKALADYAAIAIVNGRLFRMMEQRARSMETAYRELQTREAERSRQVQTSLARLKTPLAALEAELARLAQGSEGKLPPQTAARLTALSKQVNQMATLVAGLTQRQS